MRSLNYSTVFCVLVLVARTYQLPAPQDDEDYGDFTGSNDETEEIEPDPLGGFVGQFLDGFGQLVDHSVNAIGSLVNGNVSNDEIAARVGEAVDIGVGATQEVVKIGTDAVSNAPKFIEEQASFVEGLGKTVQQTSGVVRESLQDVSTQAKVAAAFAETYGKLAIEGIADFVSDFQKRLKCNTDCAKMEEGTEERNECEELNCIDKDKKPAGDEEEEYDYTYGYDYDDSDTGNDKENTIQVSPRDEKKQPQA